LKEKNFRNTSEKHQRPLAGKGKGFVRKDVSERSNRLKKKRNIEILGARKKWGKGSLVVRENISRAQKNNKIFTLNGRHPGGGGEEQGEKICGKNGLIADTSGVTGPI